MNFLEAMKLLEDGYKVRRSRWGCDELYVCAEKWFCDDASNRTNLDVAIELRDFIATDWEIYQRAEPFNPNVSHA